MKSKTTRVFGATLFGILGIACLAGCSSGSGSPPESGPRTIDSGGGARTYYLKMPEGYRSGEHYPLVIAFHGTGGSSAAFVGDTYYDLEGAVGDEAILVYPDALLPDGGSTAQWDFDSDVGFFDDLLAELDGLVHYDKDRVFLTGHSSGAGFAHQLACKRGYLVRAIAPVAGTLLTQGEGCSGEVAVMQIQGTEDEFVPIAVAETARDFWQCYNGCGAEGSAGADPHCLRYQGCDADYPVEYCTHDEVDEGFVGGHTWPSFGSEAMWAFFKSLPEASPSADLPAEKRDCTAEGGATATFTLAYPDDFSGTPEILAIALYPAGTGMPTGAPAYMIKQRYDLDAADVAKIAAGAEVEYAIDGIDFENVELPADYVFSIVIYMKGGMYPIPTPRIDYVGMVPIHFDSADSFTIDDPIALSVMPDFAL